MSMPTYAYVNAGDSIVLFGDSQNACEVLGWKTPIFRGEVGAENSKRTFDVQNYECLIGAILRCHISATRQGDPCPAAQPGQQQQAPTADLLAARAAGRATPLRVARSCETVDQNLRRVWRFMDSRCPLLRVRARIRARRCLLCMAKREWNTNTCPR